MVVPFPIKVRMPIQCTLQELSQRITKDLAEFNCINGESANLETIEKEFFIISWDMIKVGNKYGLSLLIGKIIKMIEMIVRTTT